MYALDTIRSDVHLGPFQFPGVVDQTLLEATEQCVLCFLVVTVGNVGSQGLAPKSSPCPDVRTSGFLPGFHQRSEGSPDAEQEMATTFLGSVEEEL